jgi:ABC-type uncharacterized transport system permease subunit
MTVSFKTGYRICIIILAAVITLLLGAVILWTIGADVVKTYMVILTEPNRHHRGLNPHDTAHDHRAGSDGGLPQRHH